MVRLINRRRQGDLGEASAIEWLTGAGATVLIPFGHSPHFDLAAELDDHLVRIQVKTSVCRAATPGGGERWAVTLTTRGGNRSWSGHVKQLDPTRVDYLFVLVGDGRRWFIPAEAIRAQTGITLGGSRYSEFEIRSAPTLEKLVYGPIGPRLESAASAGERRRWRAGPDCKFGG